FTPVPGTHGTATISVTVNDGQSENNLFTQTFSVTITQPPVISDIPDQMTDEDTVLGPVAFSVSDLETPADNLIVTGASSDQALVPNTGLVFGGTGPNRTLTVTQADHSFGTTLISIIVTDAEGNSAQTSFLLTVNFVPHLPSILTQPQ